MRRELAWPDVEEGIRALRSRMRGANRFKQFNREEEGGDFRSQETRKEEKTLIR